MADVIVANYITLVSLLTSISLIQYITELPFCHWLKDSSRPRHLDEVFYFAINEAQKNVAITLSLLHSYRSFVDESRI